MDKEPLLLVVDMQNAYAKGQPWECENYDKALNNILKLVEEFRTQGFITIFTKHLASTKPHGVWKEYNKIYKDINEDNYVNELNSKLLPFYENSICCNKSVYSAYSSDEVQRFVGCAACVIVTGVVAECCVLSTVLDLINAGVYVFYVADAIAGVNKETEEATIKVLEGLSPLHLSVVYTNELISDKSVEQIKSF